MKNSRAQAIAQFFQDNLDMIQNDGSKAFRKAVIEYAANEQNYAVASAAATYNNLVHKAIDNGQIRKVKVGVLEVIDSNAQAESEDAESEDAESKASEDVGADTDEEHA